jgi:hypothetical protein
MAQITTERSPVVAQATHRRGVTAARHVTAVDRTAELSDDVLKSAEAGQRAAIEAVRKFVDTVLNSAMEMADGLVHTQYDFIRKVIDSAAKSLSRRDGTKSNG